MAEARLEGPPLYRVRSAKMCPSGGMVDALDSKSCSERSARSSRAWGTTYFTKIVDCGFPKWKTNALGSSERLFSAA
ncbi:MAG: hypothetical protein RLZZ61_1857 [Pseudomonadota bacterium]